MQERKGRRVEGGGYWLEESEGCGVGLEALLPRLVKLLRPRKRSIRDSVLVLLLLLLLPLLPLLVPGRASLAIARFRCSWRSSPNDGLTRRPMAALTPRRPRRRPPRRPPRMDARRDGCCGCGPWQAEGGDMAGWSGGYLVTGLGLGICGMAFVRFSGSFGFFYFSFPLPFLSLRRAGWLAGWTWCNAQDPTLAQELIAVHRILWPPNIADSSVSGCTAG